MTVAEVSTQASTRIAFRRAVARPRHGCAWFIWPLDAPDRDPHRAGGWMAIDGQSATWFNSPQDLPVDVIWWTNLEPASAWSLGRHTHIKADGFLGLDWFSLLSRFGRPIGPDATKVSISLWSELFSRLASEMDRWCAQDQTSKHPFANPSQLPSPDWSWGEGDFIESLARRLGVPAGVGTGGAAAGTPTLLSAAWTTQVFADWPAHRTDGKRRLSLLLPPVAHASHVRHTRVPAGTWRELPPGQWPLQDDRRWQWLEAHQAQPVLARFDNPPQAISGHEEDLAMSWGRRGRRFPGAPYESVWLTGEEVLSLRSCLKTAPTSLWLADRWESGPVQPWPASDPSDPLVGCSVLTGILDGAFWRAWSTPLRDDRRVRPEPTPLAVWWRAADRLACLNAARACQATGVDVLSYGNGQVQVAFDSDRQLVDWDHTLTVSGLSIPYDLASVARVPDPPEFDAKTVEAWLLSSKQPLEAWFSIDRMLSPWLGDDRNQLKSLMSGTLDALTQIPPPAGAKADWTLNWRALLLERSRYALSQRLPNAR